MVQSIAPADYSMVDFFELFNCWTTSIIQLLIYMHYSIVAWIIQWFNPALGFYKDSLCKQLCPP